MKILLGVSAIISLVLSLIFLPRWIKKCHEIGLVWEDMNKFNQKKKIASSGGVVVVVTFTIGVLSYIAMRTFFIGTMHGVTTYIFALLTTILLLSVIALVDDLFGWKNGGLSRRFRILLTLLASIPLVVINAGTHVVSLPFFGVVNLGVVYPLFLIPIGILGATTTYNFLAGLNGLETGQGILILSFLSFVAYITGNPWLTIVGLCMIAPLMGFYFYNKFPARVFPGDTLTYSVGALIAILAILGNFEKIAMFVFIPYMIEFGLKVRGRLKKHSFGKPNEDGSLSMPYERIYSLNHLAICMLKKLKKKVYERDVVYVLFIFQILVILSALLIFWRTLFT